MLHPIVETGTIGSRAGASDSGAIQLTITAAAATTSSSEVRVLRRRTRDSLVKPTV